MTRDMAALASAIAAELLGAVESGHIDLCWAPSIDFDVIRPMLEEGDLVAAAKALEMVGLLDRNLSICPSWVQWYLHSTYIQLASLCYWCANMRDYAAALARANFVHSQHSFQASPEAPTRARLALTTELKADIAALFDSAIAERLYADALAMAASLGVLEEDGEVCDLYWGVADQAVSWVFTACLDTEEAVIRLDQRASVRIPQKREIMARILMRA